MILDVIENSLIIKLTNNKLKPRHKSQLYDWGFSRGLVEGTFHTEKDIEVILLKIVDYFDKSKVKYELSDSCRNLLDELLEKRNEFRQLVEIGRDYKNGKFDYRLFVEHVTFIDQYISRPLKEHQIKASFHLSLVKNGANFSVPGSGKTAVVLTVFQKLKIRGEVNTLFVVGPPACFGPWKEEFKAVLGKKPNFKILAGGDRLQRKVEYYNSDKLADIYLTTFQSLLNDQDDIITFFKNKKVNAFLVIDEAHYIKQVNGNWANAALKIAINSNYRCILTGTPIPKSYVDLYNLFDFLWPNDNPLSSEEKIRLRILEEQKDYKDAREILEQTLGPLFYRVRKYDLGLKPQVFHEPNIIKMNPFERKIYDAITKKIRTYAKEDYLRNIDLVLKLRRGRMIRLRQCLSYTKLLTTAIDDYDESIIEQDHDLKYLISNYDKSEKPAKLHLLLDIIKEFKSKKEKIVIWSYFIGTISLIQRKITELGFYCKKIIGEIPIERSSVHEEETREGIINEFISDKSGLDILIANPAACAESISLHKTCHSAIYYDLSYNCAQYLQSLDRIHRVGGILAPISTEHEIRVKAG